MSATRKIDHNFGELKRTRFVEGQTPINTWGHTPVAEVDVIEQLRFNVSQIKDLNSRFNFLLEELSGVLIKKNPKL